eukprot:scaffold827_cov369-Prasinococcus_capsulatus_cf.AAC.24
MLIEPKLPLSPFCRLPPEPAAQHTRARAHRLSRHTPAPLIRLARRRRTFGVPVGVLGGGRASAGNVLGGVVHAQHHVRMHGVRVHQQVGVL